MNPWDLLLLLLGQGVVVSWITDLFKRLEVVRNHPKLVAGLLNLLLILVHTYGLRGLPEQATAVVIALITTLMTSIGAHELKDATLRWLGVGAQQS